MERILSLISNGLNENRRQEQYIHRQSTSIPDTVEKLDSSSIGGGSVHTVTGYHAHSNRHSVLPFSKTWGYARLHGMALWAGRKTGERY
jgi:hypothetical protein